MAILQPKFAKQEQKYMPKCSMLKCIRDIYPGRIDMHDNLPNISIGRRFPGKNLYHHVLVNAPPPPPPPLKNETEALITNHSFT